MPRLFLTSDLDRYWWECGWNTSVSPASQATLEYLVFQPSYLSSYSASL